MAETNEVTPEIKLDMSRAIPAPGQNSNNGNTERGINLEETREIVSREFPYLWPAVEAGLATCATLLLKDNANPVALIYVGPASAGKTTVASMFEGATVKGKVLCYRTDNFTPAAFVSHSAKATKKQLQEIDLLPRIRDKVLLTPELATIFRGKPDDLAVRFSIITRVLDGQGLTTDSGTHGQRGYTGDCLFAWIGCTTPFSSSVWRVMGQLGSRLFFLVMDTVADPTVDDLVQANNQAVPYRDSLRACREAVHSFLDSLFTQQGGVREVGSFGLLGRAYPRRHLHPKSTCAGSLGRPWRPCQGWLYRSRFRLPARPRRHRDQADVGAFWGGRPGSLYPSGCPRRPLHGTLGLRQ